MARRFTGRSSSVEYDERLSQSWLRLAAERVRLFGGTLALHDRMATTDEVMPRVLDLPAALTTQQREAILHDGGPLLIIAGPGSGKTEVLTWRVAYLVSTGLTAPAAALVCTFARKAALELQDRIQRKL